MSEGPPQKEVKVLDQDFVPERLVSDDMALEAMRTNKLEVVRRWYEELQEQADKDPSPKSRTLLMVRMAEMQNMAGFPDMAIETANAAYEDAYQRGDTELTITVEGVLKRLEKR